MSDVCTESHPLPYHNNIKYNMPADNIEYQENFKMVQRSVHSAHKRWRMSYNIVHKYKVVPSHSMQILDTQHIVIL